MCRTVAVPSTQEAKQKKKRSQPPAPFRPYARRDAPSQEQESHTFRLYTCNSKQKAFENNVIMSSLQRDPYPLPSARSQSFRPRLRCVCLLGDAMCMVNFFFLLSGYVQLPVGALTCATAEEQVSFLLLCRSLRRLCACGRQEKKNFLCSARTSLALFGKKRDLTRVDRRPRGRGGAGDKNGKGGPSRRVPRCWCSTPASLLCRGVVSVRPARHAVFVVSCGCACVFFVFGFLPNGLLFFFFFNAVAQHRAVSSSTRRHKDQKAQRFVVRIRQRRTTSFVCGTFSLSPRTFPTVSLSAKK